MKEMEKTTTLSAAVTESSTLLTPGGPVQRKGKKKRTTSSSASASSIAYRGYNIYQSAQQGSLPVCVLLWGMASAKRVNLMTPDQDGNNPLHMAAMADTPEVSLTLVCSCFGVMLLLLCLWSTLLLCCSVIGFVSVL